MPIAGRAIIVVLGAVAVALSVSCVMAPTQPSSSNPPPSSPAPAASTPACSVRGWACTSQYGAIAYASNGAVGWSFDYSTQAAANSRALQECGSGCSVVAQFSNSCGAIATAPTGRAGWATAQSGDLAQAQALFQCMR